METTLTSMTEQVSKSSAKLVELKEIQVEVAENYECFYVIEGTMLLHMNEEVNKLNQGDLFIANPGDAFMILPKEETTLLLSISIDAETARKSEGKTFLYTNISRKEDLHYSPIHAFYKFYDDYTHMEKEQLEHRIHYLIEKLKPLAYEVAHYEAKRDSKIQMIINAASKIYFSESDASLDAIAADLGISSSYLSRVFKEVSGMGFSDYSQRKKLEISSILLQEDLTIDKVAEQTGFASTKSLNRIYNQLLKKTPSQYRRELLHTPKADKSQESLRKRPAYQKFASQFSELSYGNAILESLGQEQNYHKISLNRVEADRHPFDGMAYKLLDFGQDYLKEIREFHDNGKVSGIIIKLTIDESKPNLVFLQNANRWMPYNEIIGIFIFLDTLKIPVGLHVQVADLSVKDACNALKRDVLNRSTLTIKDFLVKLLQLTSRPLAQKIIFVFDLSFVLDLKEQRAVNLFSEHLERRHQVLERVLQGTDFRFAYSYGNKTTSELESILDFISKNRHRFRLPNFSFYQLIMPKTIHLTESYLFNQAVEEYNYNLEVLKKLDQSPELKAINMIHEGTITTIEVNELSSLYTELIASILSLDYYLKLDAPVISNANYSFVFSDTVKKQMQVYETRMVDFSNYRTPLYHLAKGLNAMNGAVVYFKNGCVVTRNSEKFNVLLYNHPIFDYVFALEKGFEYIDKYSADVTFEITGVMGKYKESSELINYRHGSNAYHLQNFSDPNLMTPKEKDYVRLLSIPKMMSDFHDFNGTLTRTFSLSPFEVLFLSYTPI